MCETKYLSLKFLNAQNDEIEYLKNMFFKELV